MMETWLVLLGVVAMVSALPAAPNARLPSAAGEPPPASPLAPTPWSDDHGGGRVRRSALSSSDSSEDSASPWRPQSASKPQFVTKRGQEPLPAFSARSAPDSAAAASPRFNEIPLGDRAPTASGAYPTRYESSNYAPAPRSVLPRRIIYYADLPEIPRPRSRAYADPRSYSPRDYDPYGPGSGAQNKYVRDGRIDDRSPYGGYNRDDWYRYRSSPVPPPSPSYTIIDADRPSPGGYSPAPAQPYPNSDPSSRYYRVPAPYQRNAAGSLPPLAPSSTYDQYRRQPVMAPPRINVGSNRFSEPYRDYNPHQAAPWSMQIGTKLTVKDENRDKYGPGYGPGRRFYVQSQDPGPYRPLPPPARYDRVEDDPRHRL